MGMILHDWKLEKKMYLIRAAYAALPPGGALVAIEARTAQLGRFSLLRESWRFVGAGPPARGHGNVEYAQIHAELAAVLVPVAEHDVAQELRSRLGQDFPSVVNHAPRLPHCHLVELWQQVSHRRDTFFKQL
jgi:hypothetical protein